MKCYGLKFDVKKPEDYIFGASLPMEIINPSGDWTPYLPQKEFQNLNGIEPFSCVSYTILNCVEILIKKQYGEEVNYSERFLAAISGTKEGGNSPNVVCDFLRKIGVVPEVIWPFDSSITSFEKYYESIPERLLELAKDFNAKWEFKYEDVPFEMLSRALQCSPLLVSVPAWFQNVLGLFYRPEGMSDNHATTLIKEEQGLFRRVFDSYDSPYIKDIDWSVVPMVIKRFYIHKKKVTTVSLWSRILAWCLSKLYA